VWRSHWYWSVTWCKLDDSIYMLMRLYSCFNQNNLILTSLYNQLGKTRSVHQTLSNHALISLKTFIVLRDLLEAHKASIDRLISKLDITCNAWSSVLQELNSNWSKRGLASSWTQQRFQVRKVRWSSRLNLRTISLLCIWRWIDPSSIPIGEGWTVH